MLQYALIRLKISKTELKIYVKYNSQYNMLFDLAWGTAVSLDIFCFYKTHRTVICYRNNVFKKNVWTS